MSAPEKPITYWTDRSGIPVDYDSLVAGALAGNLGSLEELLRAIQDGVFNLALKFLWQPEDAADATQEILLRITTRLKTFRGESAFPTWAYRVAVNYLLNAKKSRAERGAEARSVSFDTIAHELRQGNQRPAFEEEVELAMLRDQVRMACLHAMLLCLSREYRMAFVLGFVFDLSGEEGAYIMQIEPAAFRKRLSRARIRMAEFMGTNCGLVRTTNACRCEQRIDYSLRTGKLEPYLALADRLRRSGELERMQKTYGDEIEYLTAMSGAFTGGGYYTVAKPETNREAQGADSAVAARSTAASRGVAGLSDFAADLRRLYESRQLKILQDDPN